MEKGEGKSSGKLTDYIGYSALTGEKGANYKETLKNYRNSPPPLRALPLGANAQQGRIPVDLPSGSANARPGGGVQGGRGFAARGARIMGLGGGGLTVGRAGGAGGGVGPRGRKGNAILRQFKAR